MASEPLPAGDGDPLRARLRRVRAAGLPWLFTCLLAITQMAAAPAPAKLLESYRNALTLLRRPAFLEFDYTQTRSGPSRIITEQHRVYRTDTGQERNDTVMINGTAIVPALSRILRRSVWPYDVAQFAASADEYNFAAVPTAFVAGRKAFGIRLTRKASVNFMLTDLYLDIRRYLPLREGFSVTGGDCSGAGIINFGPAGPYWLPTSVQVTCTTSSSALPAIFKESIRFSNYAFPNGIPADVFRAVQPAAESKIPGGASSSTP